MNDGPAPRFLASVIAYAGEVQDARVYRLAMIAGDLLDRMTAQRQNIDHPVARSMGWTGAAGRLADRPGGIAGDVLAAAQASLDSEEPDPATIAAGIGAARRLIGIASATSNDDALRFMASTLLGGDGGYAPKRLTGGVDASDEETE